MYIPTVFQTTFLHNLDCFLSDYKSRYEKTYSFSCDINCAAACCLQYNQNKR